MESVYSQQNGEMGIGLGNEEDLAHYFRVLFRPMCFYAEYYVRQMDQAEDIVSRVFLECWKKGVHFPNEEALKAYLYRSVKNASLNHLRLSKPLPVNLSVVADKTPLELMIQAEVLNDIYLAIERLPRQCRTIFSKLFIEGKTVREIAAEMELSISTVKNQKAIGLNMLRKRLRLLALWMVSWVRA